MTNKSVFYKTYNIMIVYTDGACSGNGTDNQIGGIGIHFPGKEFTDVSEKVIGQSNNYCELLAIKVALEMTNGQASIIYTDSLYAVNSLTKWMSKWKVDGTMSTRPNSELLLTIESLLGSTKLVHIKRSTHEGNTIADRLAVAAKLKA